MANYLKIRLEKKTRHIWVYTTQLYLRHHRPEHGQVLQRHLTGAVLANRAAHMRASEVGVGLRDGAHADLVEGARPEGGERARERHRPVAARDPDGHARQILLGDEALDEPVRIGVPELDRVGRVLHVTVKRHHLCHQTIRKFKPSLSLILYFKGKFLQRKVRFIELNFVLLNVNRL